MYQRINFTQPCLECSRNRITMNFLIIIPDQEHLVQMANNFRQQKEEELAHLKDSPHQAIYLDMIRLNDKGMILRNFQEHVVLLVNAYHRVMDDDDLIESIAAGTIDPDLDAVIKLIAHIEQQEPWGMVLSLIPVDMNGTVGAIITKKSK